MPDGHGLKFTILTTSSGAIPDRVTIALNVTTSLRMQVPSKREAYETRILSVA
jgi:hypothetical protein